MLNSLSLECIDRFRPSDGSAAKIAAASDRTGWALLPRIAQAYVVTVIVAGALLMATLTPTSYPRGWMFLALLLVSCLTSLWKVTLPLALVSGSTLSVSYAAVLMALLLLGPHSAMVIAVAGAWTQCALRTKQRYPWYRTVFSMAAEAITIQTTGLVFAAAVGTSTVVPIAALPKAVAAAIGTYFLVNTGLVAGAIGLSTRRRVWTVWHENFLWSAPSFMVAGGAGALAALVIDRGNPWLALLMTAPVYLSYRSYHLFLGRIDDERRHVEETERLHSETIEALLQARRAEQALAEEKERLAVTLRSIGDGVITTDLDGNVLLINQAAESLTGWTLVEAAGKPLDSVFRNVDSETRQPCGWQLSLLAADAGRVRVQRSSALMARDGVERPIEQVAAPLRDGQGRTIGTVVVFRDITDALKVQEERAKASQTESLGLLAGGIAHDFNSILMAIMGNLSMAQASARGAATRRALDDAHQACLRARQLTWQLLTFSRGAVPVKQTLALTPLVKEAAGIAVRGSNVDCALESGASLWDVSADKEQIVRVITNLVVNARQAMPDGGTIRITAQNIFEAGHRCEHALAVEPGRYVRISVTDAGVGIPEHNLGRIFDPYFSTKANGTGLGLATVYSIVKNHGGYVSVASKPGDGTTLTINLPAGDQPPSAMAVSARTAAGPSQVALMGHDEDHPATLGAVVAPCSWRVH